MEKSTDVHLLKTTSEKLSNYKSIDTSEESQEKKHIYQVMVAYVVCVSSMVLSCASVACVQVLGGAVPEFELNAWRFGVQVILLLPVTLYRKCDLNVPRSKLPVLFAMFLVFNASNVVYFSAAIYLAVGTVSGIANSLNIAGNALMSIFIKDDRNIQLYIGTVLVIVGLLLMTQPPFMFPGNIFPPVPEKNFTSPCLITEIGNSTEGVENPAMNKQCLGYILAVLGGILFFIMFQGMSNIVTEVSSFTFAFWNGLVGTCVSLILMGFLETPVMPTSPLCIILLLGHAVGTSQIGIILPWCLQYLSPSICAMVNSFSLVVLLMLQYTALKDIQPGHGNWVEILGAVLCFIGIVACPTWHLYKGNTYSQKSKTHILEF